MAVRKYPLVKCKICGAKVGLTYLARHMNTHTTREKEEAGTGGMGMGAGSQ